MLALSLCRDFSCRICVIACSVIVAATTVAFTQETQPDSPPIAAEPSPKNGLLNEIGKLLKSPADLLPSLTKPAPDPKPEAATEPASPVAPAAPPAPAAASAIPPPPPTTPAPVGESPTAAPASQFFPGFVGGREICPVSPNGSPDCQAAANRLCQSKGYKSGKSLNTDAAYSCSAKRAPGRKPCGSDNFVTRAFCQ